MPSVTSFKVGPLELLDGVKFQVFGEALYALAAGPPYEEVLVERPGTTPQFVRKQVQPKTVPLQVLLLRGLPDQRRLDFETLISYLRPTNDALLFDVRWIEYGIIRKVQAMTLEIGPGPWYQRAAAELVIPDPFPLISFPGKVIGTNGVTSYYRLNEGLGLGMVDYLGGTYSGAYTGSPTLQQPGCLADGTDYSILWNGTSQYGRSSAAYALAAGASAACSIETWIKTTDATASDRHAAAHAGLTATTANAAITKLAASPTKISFGPLNAPTDATRIAGATVTSAKTVNDGLWHHVVGVCQKGVGVWLYVDGILDTKVTHLLPTWVPALGNSQVGSINGAGFWAGNLDEVAFYNRALTDGEVAAHYAAGITAL